MFDVAQRLAWPPEYGGRALRNAYFDRWEHRLDELAADDAAAASSRRPRPPRTTARRTSTPGRAPGCSREERSVADVLADLAAAEDLLRRF